MCVVGTIVEDGVANGTLSVTTSLVVKVAVATGFASVVVTPFRFSTVCSIASFLFVFVGVNTGVVVVDDLVDDLDDDLDDDLVDDLVDPVIFFCFF